MARLAGHEGDRPLGSESASEHHPRPSVDAGWQIDGKHRRSSLRDTRNDVADRLGTARANPAPNSASITTSPAKGWIASSGWLVPSQFARARAASPSAAGSPRWNSATETPLS
jgi:hypothetical protein